MLLHYRNWLGFSDCTSGPASAHDISAVKRTTASAGSSSDVGTTVVMAAAVVVSVCVRIETKP